MIAPAGHRRPALRRMRPVGYAENVRDLDVGHSGEVAHLDHADESRIQPLQIFERRMDVQDFPGSRCGRVGHRGVEGHVPHVPATTVGPRAVRGIDDDRSHHGGGLGQEMRATRWAQALPLRELQVALVDERRGFHGAVGAVRKPAVREVPKLRIEQLELAVERRAVARLRPRDQMGHLPHAIAPCHPGSTGMIVAHAIWADGMIPTDAGFRALRQHRHFPTASGTHG
jgi:hypothetical protein